MKSKRHDEQKQGKGVGGLSRDFDAVEDWRPTCLYLYYLKPKDEDHADVQVYVNEADYRLDGSNIDGFISSTLVLIKNRKLLPAGWAFRDVRWRRVSYIAMIADHTRYVLTRTNIKLERSGSHASYTFKDLKDIGGLADPLSGARCLNDMMGWNSRRLGEDDDETFRVKLKFKARPRYARAEPRSHNDSGTNLGPPQPPPP